MNEDHAYMYHLLETAKKLKEDGEDLDLVMTIIGPNPPALMNLNRWWGPEFSKHKVLETIGAMLGFGLDAQTIYLVSEAWMSTLPAEGMTKDEALAYVDSKDYVRPSKDPNRTEVIMVHEIHKDGKQYCILCPFERRLSGFVFEEPKIMKEHVDFTFKSFFNGLKKAEELVAAFLKLTGKAPDYVFPDSGKTAMDHSRAGAIKAAKETFHIDIEEVHDASSN